MRKEVHEGECLEKRGDGHVLKLLGLGEVFSLRSGVSV